MTAPQATVKVGPVWAWIDERKNKPYLPLVVQRAMRETGASREEVVSALYVETACRRLSLTFLPTCQVCGQMIGKMVKSVDDVEDAWCSKCQAVRTKGALLNTRMLFWRPGHKPQ